MCGLAAVCGSGIANMEKLELYHVTEFDCDTRFKEFLFSDLCVSVIIARIFLGWWFLLVFCTVRYANKSIKNLNNNVTVSTASIVVS